MSGKLTPRELETLKWVAAGKTTREIAIILGISKHTVRYYVKSLHIKLDCSKSAQLVLQAIKQGYLAA